MTYLRTLPLRLVLQLAGVAAAVDTWVLSGSAKGIGYDVIGAVYVAVMLVAARRSPLAARRSPPPSSVRAGWLLVAFGFGLWTVGDLAGSYYSVVLKVSAPSPGPPDVLYLLGYPVAAAGLIWLSRAASRPNSFGDAAIVTCGAMGCDLVQGYLFAKPQPADIIGLELSAGPASVSAAHPRLAEL